MDSLKIIKLVHSFTDRRSKLLIPHIERLDERIKPFLVAAEQITKKIEPHLPAITEGLKQTMEFAKQLQAAQEEAEKIIALSEDGGLSDFYNLPPVNGLTVLAIMSRMDDKVTSKAKELLKESHSELSSKAANTRFEKNKSVKEYVQDLWIKDKAEYKSKADFSRIMQPIVQKEFEVKVTARTIEAQWLKGM